MHLIGSTGVGGYVAGERHTFIAPKYYRPDGSTYGVLYFPPKGQTASDVTADFVARAIVSAGFPLISGDLGNLTGSTPQWFNDTAMSRCDSLWSYFKSMYGVRTDGVFVLGQSMGGGTGLLWTKRNPSIVKALTLAIPVMNLPYVHDNNPGSLGDSTSTLEAAYGGSGSWAANVVGHSASEFPTQMGGVPIKMWYADSDTDVFTPTHFYNEFATACPTVKMRSGGPVGHITSWINPDEMIQFLSTYK